MYRIILIFLIYIATYHISTTFLNFAIDTNWYNTRIPLIRDGVRAITTIIIALLHRTQTKQILKQTYKRRGTFLLTIWFAVLLSRWIGQSRYSILVGIKYGFLYLLILLASIHLASWRTQAQFGKFFRTIWWLYIGIVAIWRIRQIAKHIRPDLFFQLWYGPIGNFVFGENPPIYYRTWPWWDPRLQGLFAWPNNYGYFLVATFPFLIYRIKQYIRTSRHKRLQYSIIILRVVSIIATLSRAAMLGLAICAIILFKDKRQKNKKLFIWLWILTILGLWILSIYKWWSTIEHISQKRQWLQEVIHNPLGYWLGTAWPAIHHNWTILPENYYLQLMVDIGTAGFILRTGIIASWFLLLQKFKSAEWYERQRAFFIWILALFVMWFFLHVFEDSMVNYLIFIPYAISLTYLIKQWNKENVNLI